MKGAKKVEVQRGVKGARDAKGVRYYNYQFQ